MSQGIDKGDALLIIGLGSIGQRHLRNLYALGYTNLHAVSSGKGTMNTCDLPLRSVEDDLDAALHRVSPKAAFICNPTAFHMDTAIRCALVGCHLFLEKPVGAGWEGVETLREIAAEKQLHTAVGFQFRQHPVLGEIRNRLLRGEFGDLLSARMHWGEFLPGWHPWEDYKKAYSAVESMGGGVTFTLSHPFDYLRWMLGEPDSVQAEILYTQTLGIEVDDVHFSTWKFSDGRITASVYLDYHERPPSHQLTLVGTKAKVEWSNEHGTAFFYPADPDRPDESIGLPQGFGRNDLFMAEIRDFMESAGAGRPSACTLDDGIANLRMILAARHASHQHQRVSMNLFNPGSL